MKHEPKPFKFQQFWAKHDSFKDIMTKMWNKKKEGNRIKILHCKLKELRLKLRRLNADSFSNISSTVAEKRIMFEELNGKILADHLDPELLFKAANVEKDYKVLCDAEFQFYQSKSRM
ncbi:hypothetical protein LIER_39597 [Lithospermum erythrorhizon]|uniref:Uncharacterized protein n=1 Tax=Lithospermum erythrorhizon TaxID=34254 RepID=A0AAV3QI80_LITER